MKNLIYFLKQSLIIFMYLFGTLIIGLGISMIGDNLFVLKVILSVLNISMFLAICGMFYFIMGKKALKQAKINNEEREEILRTGVIKPLDTGKEYASYKGFAIGFTAFVIMFVLLIIELILGQPSNTINLLLTVLYGTFYFPLKVVADTAPNFYILYGAVLTIAVSGVCYILGANKEKKLYASLEEIDDEIYGEGK